MTDIKVYKGQEIKPHINKLAELRVKEFYNFPYLYVGTIEEDALHSAEYAENDDSLLIIAFADDNVVGLYSGTPFNSPMSFLQAWKIEALRQGRELEGYYYLGELIVEKEWRNKGIGAQIIKRLFDEIKKMGYEKVGGVTSIRPSDHPLRPENYEDTDEVWPKFGLFKTNVTLTVNYPTRQSDGSVIDETNFMALWVKGL